MHGGGASVRRPLSRGNKTKVVRGRRQVGGGTAAEVVWASRAKADSTHRRHPPRLQLIGIHLPGTVVVAMVAAMAEEEVMAATTSDATTKISAAMATTAAASSTRSDAVQTAATTGRSGGEVCALLVVLQ